MHQSAAVLGPVVAALRQEGHPALALCALFCSLCAHALVILQVSVDHQLLPVDCNLPLRRRGPAPSTPL